MSRAARDALRKIIRTTFVLLQERSISYVFALATAPLGAAIYLILEMDRPLDGLIKLRELPLRAAVKYLGN